MTRATRILTALLALFLLAASPARAQSAETAQVNAILDMWHDAAAHADAETYFGAMAADCVFIGTDASERWLRDELREWAREYFERDSAWVFVPTERHVSLSADLRTAWFDEKLDSPHMGACRGSGVLVRDDESWIIKHYTLSFAIPNDIADDVIAKVAEHEGANGAAAQADGGDAQPAPDVIDGVKLGRWRVAIEAPGGPIPFELITEEGPAGELTASIVNADEWIQVPVVEWRDNGLFVFEFDQYESSLTVAFSPDGEGFYGQYTKRKGGFKWDRLGVTGALTDAPRFERHTPEEFVVNPAFTPIDGTWKVVFEDKPDTPAIGVFESVGGGTVHGTFLTTVGDYRYLEGTYEHGRLRLSVWDGAHAFRFDATVSERGVMRGEFLSGEHYQTSFTAERSDEVELADPFTLAKWTGGDDLGAFTFVDVDGNEWSLDDPSFAGEARIIQVMGTWCPNCKDETQYLIELHNEYASRGLSIVTVCFELTKDAERNAEVVRTFVERMGVPYPVLIAGGSDEGNKRDAARAVGFLDKVVAYPTAVFMDSDGAVRAVHTGFMGPATGAEHLKLRAAFEGLIEEMLE